MEGFFAFCNFVQESTSPISTTLEATPLVIVLVNCLEALILIKFIAIILFFGSTKTERRKGEMTFCGLEG
jgi:hypothetical protein